MLTVYKWRDTCRWSLIFRSTRSVLYCSVVADRMKTYWSFVDITSSMATRVNISSNKTWPISCGKLTFNCTRHNPLAHRFRQFRLSYAGRAFNYWPDSRVFNFVNLANSQNSRKLNAHKSLSQVEWHLLERIPPQGYKTATVKQTRILPFSGKQSYQLCVI